MMSTSVTISSVTPSQKLQILQITTQIIQYIQGYNLWMNTHLLSKNSRKTAIFLKRPYDLSFGRVFRVSYNNLKNETNSQKNNVPANKSCNRDTKNQGKLGTKKCVKQQEESSSKHLTPPHSLNRNVKNGSIAFKGRRIRY